MGRGAGHDYDLAQDQLNSLNAIAIYRLFGPEADVYVHRASIYKQLYCAQHTKQWPRY